MIAKKHFMDSHVSVHELKTYTVSTQTRKHKTSNRTSSLKGFISIRLAPNPKLQSYPDKSLSMTIFCRPVEMLQPASAGGEPILSEDWTGFIWTLDGLVSAVVTSLRILGRGPSLEAELCGTTETNQFKSGGI